MKTPWGSKLSLGDIVTWIKGLPANEPVLVGTTAVAVLTDLIGHFGFNMPSGDIMAIGSVLTVVTGFIIRQFVTPAK